MKKFLSLVLTLVMAMSLVTIGAGATDFTDSDDIQYTEAVDVISALEVVDGYEDGSFNPSGTLTRGAAAKIICNLLLGPTTADALSADAAPFSDVPTTNTFAGYITYCAQQGIISGYADGTFRPAGTLTSYAFMKMLLGALGYDAEAEGFNGANWSVQVAKTALGIELDEGLVDDFNGLAAVTREEACLYAFNTLTANMVSYGSTTSMTVNGAEINISGEREWDRDTTSSDGNIDGEAGGDSIVQFAERYFTRLVLDDDETDAFGRPANTWVYRNDEIGTYAKTADATYVTDTAEADIYSDIGLTSNDEFFVYVDGIPAADYDSSKYDDVDDDGDYTSLVTIHRGEEDDEIGEGNGAIIEVFKDDRIITIINTYVGEVLSVEEATSRRDAYIELGTVGDDTSVYDNDAGTVLDAEYRYDTEAFDVGDIVTFHYSMSEEEVHDVQAAEIVTGNVESFTSNRRFSMDGTTYEYGAKKTNIYGSADIGTESTIYLDENGYVLYAEEGDGNVRNYALVLNAGTESALAGNNHRAYLLFTDGSTAVVDTDKAYYDGYVNGVGTGDLVGYWVTYKTNSDGEYVLTMPGDSDDHLVGSNTCTVETDNGSTGVDLGSDSARVNSSTVILVEDADGDITVYEGVKDIPTITGTNNAESYAAYGTGSFLKLLYIELNSSADVDTGSSKTIFLVGDTDSTEVQTSSDRYYVFDAVVDGVLMEDGVMLDATDGSFTSGTTTVDGVAYTGTETAAVINYLLSGASIALDSYSEDDGFYTVNLSDVTGYVESGYVEKSSGNVIDFDGDAYYVADDCVFFRVTSSGRLSASSVSGVRSADVGSGEYYAQVFYTTNSDEELTGVYWVLN